MKKTMSLLFPALLLILFGLFFQLPTAAAEEAPNPIPESGQQDFVIDGILYHLSWGSNYVGAAEAYLELPENYTGSLPDEITVRSEITWNDITFPVDAFWYNASPDSIGDLTKRKITSPDYYQQHLKKITVEAGVRNINLSLAHYDALEEIVLENPSSSIYATINVWDCPQLKDIYVPSNIDSVPHLRDCPKTSIVYAPDHPRYQTIDGDIYSRNGKTLYDVPSTAKKYYVRDGVERIAFEAFAGNGSIKKIILPDSVRKIKRQAFFNMKNLKKVKLGNTVKQIYGTTFKRTKKLKVLVLPKSVRQITGSFGTKRFSGLTKLYINSPKLNKADFGGVPKTCKIYVKNASVKKMIQKYSKFKGQIIIR